MKTFITITSDTENITVVENFIDQLSAEYKISDELYGNILVAALESVTNAITHGNHCDPTKYVFISTQIEGNYLVLSVKDEGLGFDPAKLGDPTKPENILKFSGRGVYLIRELSDRTEFLEGGTLINMYFDLTKTDENEH